MPTTVLIAGQPGGLEPDAGFEFRLVDPGSLLSELERDGAEVVLADWPWAEAILRPMREQAPEVRLVLRCPQWTPGDVVLALRNEAFWLLPASTSRSALREVLELRPAAFWRQSVEVLSGTSQWLSVRLLCCSGAAERLTAFLRMYLTGIAECDDIVTAARELLLNGVEHGCRADHTRWLQFTCVRAASLTLFHIQDPGPGFALDQLPHAAAAGDGRAPLAHAQIREEQGLRPGGFGILMARQLTDELIYNQKGNQVLAVKRRRR